MTSEFGLGDYWRMYKARGIRLPLTYFLENHLFDLTRGTDTHTWLRKDRFDVGEKNLDRGNIYMCSWRSMIERSFDFVCGHVGADIARYCFVDIGCGKGKVLISWREMARKRNLRLRMIGIDYSDALVRIAKANFRKLFAEEPEILVGDILDIDFDRYGNSFCFYMYNPFDAVVMDGFLDRIRNKRAIVVYTNPVHLDVFLNRGFEVIFERKSWHPNGEMAILKSP